MNELTGYPASTIHRLLGITIDSVDDSFEDKEIDGEFLIIDEMSMVDTWLMNRVFKAAPEGLKFYLSVIAINYLLLDQGQVLTDLLETNQVPAIELEANSPSDAAVIDCRISS